MATAAAAEPIIAEVEYVDEFYFSALSNENEDEMYPISDSKYAEELQLQEALASSLSAAASKTAAVDSEAAAMEKGESSQGFCDICVEKKESEEMFRVDACSHSFCSDCVTKHVTMKLQENVAVVNCLGLDCGSTLNLEACRPRISDEVAARWDEILCESLIPAGEKFYCPFKDCSGLLVRDNEEGEEVVTQSECPHCHRLFCARCSVGWHAGFGCEEIQKLNEDEREREDLLVREMAKSNSWMRCPACGFYVEKTEGCLHMTCRQMNKKVQLLSIKDSDYGPFHQIQ